MPAASYRFDPENVPRLAEAWRFSRQSLQRAREERRDAIRQYVGGHYSDEGSARPVPVNLIASYVSIVVRNLIAKNPRALLTPEDRKYRSLCKAMQTWVNREIERQNLVDALQRAVLDAFFSVGVVKVCLASPADAAKSGYNLRAGMPYAHTVSLDDLAFDAYARDFCEADWVAHRVRVPLESVRDSAVYSAARKDLRATEPQRHNRDGDERAEHISRGRTGQSDSEYRPHVDLWEFFVPSEKVVVTLSDEQLDGAARGEPLRVQRWVGPDKGPFHFLALGVVPDNAMPKAPIHDLIDLHNLVNNLYRKLMDQAERQKTIYVAQGAAAADGTRTVESRDGEMIVLQNPEMIRTVPYPGADPGNQQFAEASRNLFSWLAGNLDSLGGLAPQAKTATQDTMLERNSSRAVADMQERVTAFTSAVLESLGWFWYHHPAQVMESEYRAPGASASITRRVRPYDPGADPAGYDHHRNAPWAAIGVRVDPYSLGYQTPQQRLAHLRAVVHQTLVPLMPLLQQQGIAFDLNAYLNFEAEYGDNPDVREVVTTVEPPSEEQAGQPGGGDHPMKPAATSRTYERVNKSEATPGGQSRAIQQALLGSNPGGAVPSVRPAAG